MVSSLEKSLAKHYPKMTLRYRTPSQRKYYMTSSGHLSASHCPWPQFPNVYYALYSSALRDLAESRSDRQGLRREENPDTPRSHSCWAQFRGSEVNSPIEFSFRSRLQRPESDQAQNRTTCQKRSRKWRSRKKKGRSRKGRSKRDLAIMTLETADHHSIGGRPFRLPLYRGGESGYRPELTGM